jgi:CubicO group peptidase (beta-lactamase class C family)
MVHTRLDAVNEPLQEAAGYTKLKNGDVVPAPAFNASCRIPAGGLVSTAEDVGRFAIALQSGRLLPPRIVRQMEANQVTPEIINPEIINRTLAGMEAPPGFKPPGMGYGFAIEIVNGETRPYHGGNQPGATGMLYLIPDRSESIVILTNLDGQGDEVTELARKIAAATAK